MPKTIQAVRYVTPLREGGSLPAIVEGNDLGLYVMKFRGAGQGVRALIAEVVGAVLARGLGLRVPELVLLDLDVSIGRNEPDPEIRHLILSSQGLNVGLDYLPGSLTFDPAAGPAPDGSLASDIVWFDAYVTNVDRTVKNPNLLTWHKNLWLIDHGAALYFHHSWDEPEKKAESAFPQIRDHVLLPYASSLEASHSRLQAELTPTLIESAVAAIPEEWLTHAERAAYLNYLQHRVAAAPIFFEEAVRARSHLV